MYLTKLVLMIIPQDVIEESKDEKCAAWVELGKNSVSNRYRKIWAVSHGIVRVYTVSEMG